MTLLDLYQAQGRRSPEKSFNWKLLCVEKFCSDQIISKVILLGLLNRSRHKPYLALYQNWDNYNLRKRAFHQKKQYSSSKQRFLQIMNWDVSIDWASEPLLCLVGHHLILDNVWLVISFCVCKEADDWRSILKNESPLFLLDLGLWWWQDVEIFNVFAAHSDENWTQNS